MTAAPAPLEAPVDRLTEDDVPAGPLLSARDIRRIDAAETRRDGSTDTYDDDRAADRYERQFGW